MTKKVWTQADIDAAKPDKDGIKSFGYGCEFGNECVFGYGCKFGDGCVIRMNCTFGLKPKFGERCCFCAPMDFLEYVERTNRDTHRDAHNALVKKEGKQ